tara:strand:+ start:529 stop:1455 length:927 start_codon:yes stop_codon:yes gene_type:complete
MHFSIITFYQFKKNLEVINIQKKIKSFCAFHKIRGTILLAKEGINGTVAGLEKSIILFSKELEDIGFSKLEKKKSHYNYMPFNRLKVKIKKEIVTFDNFNLEADNKKGKYIHSKKWNSIIEDEDTLLLDVRNNFEVEMGSFKRAINPNTKKFSEFKKYIDNKLSKNKSKKIAIYCTGGIRCEKASAYMLKKGFKNIFQLKGGILKYLNDVSNKNSKWNGECFVFDNRVSVKNEMKTGTYELCHACRYPISKKERKSNNYKKGISCPKCYGKISNEKIKKLYERNKQISIAKKRGIYNPYIKYTPSDFL